MPLEAQTGFLPEPNPDGQESDATTKGETNKLPEPTTMNQKPPATQQEIEDARELMKTFGQKEGDYPFKEGFVGVSTASSTPSTPQPKTPKDWVEQMPEAAKLNDERLKSSTTSEKPKRFRQNGSLHNSGTRSETTQPLKKTTAPPGMKLNITVCGVNDLPDKIGQRWTHVISIWDNACRRNKAYRKLVRVIAPEARLLFCFFDDTSSPSHPNAPRLRDVRRILAFTSGLTPEAKVLVQCRAGVSRSTATAYAILCQHSEPGKELEKLLHVQTLRKMVLPNRLIVRLADEALKRDGGMILGVTNERVSPVRYRI